MAEDFFKEIRGKLPQQSDVERPPLPQGELGAGVRLLKETLGNVDDVRDYDEVGEHVEDLYELYKKIELVIRGHQQAEARKKLQEQVFKQEPTAQPE